MLLWHDYTLQCITIKFSITPILISTTITAVSAAFMEVVNVQLNIHGWLKFTENWLIVKIVKFKTSQYFALSWCCIKELSSTSVYLGYILMKFRIRKSVLCCFCKSGRCQLHVLTGFPKAKIHLLKRIYKLTSLSFLSIYTFLCGLDMR